ncbi:MAG: poly-gamma-glutamate hydrolase family protein [Thermodesulfobacteriota bacterium]|nr:poly-gamma-glutamate hydrolase family protein [Thermodesulfobacteriota bacterium]
MDKYTNIAELKQNEREDEDYTILYREIPSKITIMAPHGGGIEPGTIDIADYLAGCDYTFYAFKGLKKSGNNILHINSNIFDEPIALKAAQNADIVISIHGDKDKSEVVHIGGTNLKLKQIIMNALSLAGFDARISEIPGLRGMKPENLCNRCKTGKGVQLEISRGLRETLFDNLGHRSLRKKTIVFYQFVNVLKEALLLFLRKI